MVQCNSQFYATALAPAFKLRGPEVKLPKSVVNLSNKKLGKAEVNLLAKGLNFVPKPPKPTPEDVQSSLSEFSRRLKLTHFFHNKPQSGDKKPFIEKSNWSPDDNLLPSEILSELKELEKEADKIELRNGPSNLTKSEKSAIRSLKNDKSIVIKSADKGSATVIMDRIEYIKEANRQLSNTLHYKKLSQPVFPKVSNRVNEILANLQKKKFVNKKQAEYLSVPSTPRNRELYLVPKIHKDPSKWPVAEKMPPGRPIVSDCASDTYRVAEYIDHFLAPLATKHTSYVKDTPDFLSKISKFKPSKNSLLITLDVDALYTNINNKDGLKTVKSAFENNPDPKRPDLQILELLEICLENNDFMFNGEWFLQTYGTAMGRKFAPNYANLFLAQWEKEALSKCTLLPDCYLRFLDDIFIIWPHSEQEFWTFFNTLNNHHPTIKLKASINSESVDFLDVTVFKGHNFRTSNLLDTKVYFKPTDSHELLHKESFHPKHTFKGIIKSQIIRFHRICNNKSDFEEACKTLFEALKPRRYSARFLRHIKIETLKQLNPPNQSRNGSSPCNQKKCKTCPHMNSTEFIQDGKGKSIEIKSKIDCSTTSVIYVIQCKSCSVRYVGQTNNSVHERLVQHRSDINLLKQTPVAVHFNNSLCGGLDSLSITPVEVVPKKTTGGLMPMKELLFRMEREQFWIAKINTIAPNGLNKKNELPPPIPFIPKFSDQSGKLTQLAKSSFSKIRSAFPGPFFRQKFLAATSRNKNLKDMLVRTALKD